MLYLRPNILGRFCLNLVGFLAINSIFSLNAQGPDSFFSNGRNIQVDTLNASIEKMMEEVGVPGMSFAVIEEGEIAFFETYGVKEEGKSDPIDKNTVFTGCSLSKNYLAFIAHQLVDEGLLELDRPVYTYLENERLEHDPRYKLVTPRMILSHSSGIEHWYNRNVVDTLEIIVEPGTKFLYSAEGYLYLAKAIEKILGQSYEEYITERLISPLGLKNTYLKHQDGIPDNFAVGHLMLKGNITWNNELPEAASGNHFTAEDYAKMLTALFDTSIFSKKRIKDLTTPIVSMGNNKLSYGPGFVLYESGEEVIVEHGGDWPGYKNLIFYSPQKQRGFVMLTNSDRGKWMAERLSEWTVGIDVSPLCDHVFVLYDQYPSPAIDLLNFLEENGKEALLDSLETLKGEGNLSYNTLSALGPFVFERIGDLKTQEILLNMGKAMFPDSAFMYEAKANLDIKLFDFVSAVENLKKANELENGNWYLEKQIKDCENELADLVRRQDNLTKISKNGEALLEAEDYNAHRGVQIEPTADEGGGKNLGYIDSNDWVDYKVEVEQGGEYEVTFRIASVNGWGQFDFRSDGKILTIIDIPKTNGWQKFASVSGKIVLKPGIQTLRLFAHTGGFNINWIKLSYLRQNEN